MRKLLSNSSLIKLRQSRLRPDIHGGLVNDVIIEIITKRNLIFIIPSLSKIFKFDNSRMFSIMNKIIFGLFITEWKMIIRTLIDEFMVNISQESLINTFRIAYGTQKLYYPLDINEFLGNVYTMPMPAEPHQHYLFINNEGYAESLPSAFGAMILESICRTEFQEP